MKKYSEDYDLVETIDDKGRVKRKAVYSGNYYEITVDEESLVKFKKSSLLLLAGILLSHISVGFINNQGMNQFYVIFPYVIVFFPLMYLISGILSLPWEKRNYIRSEIGLSFDRMKSSSMALITFLGLGIFGELVFLIFGAKADDYLLEFLHLFLDIFTTAAVYYIIHLQKQIPTQKISKKNN